VRDSDYGCAAGRGRVFQRPLEDEVRDLLPALQSTLAIVVVLANAVVDIITAWLDPRLRRPSLRT
jgi:ABC-type dipeptide/oligopeptide/nickel transport system permease component